jgi:AraC-like DNA-binding protein
LAQTNAPLADLAQECGFGDLPAMVRAFKHELGVTPGAWRQAVQRERRTRPPRSGAPGA